MAIITITTVGYGEYWLFSPMGRAVGVAVALWGGILTSLSIITVFEQLEFTRGEHKSMELLDDLNNTEEL